MDRIPIKFLLQIRQANSKSHEHFGQKDLIINLAFPFEICLFAKAIDDVFFEHPLGDNFHFCFGEVAGIISIEYLEDFYDVRTQVLFVDFLQHVQQEFLEIYGTIAILIHLFQLSIHLFLANVVPQPSQQELESATGDVAGVVAVVHLENLL
jgi:hypothetical protein